MGISFCNRTHCLDFVALVPSATMEFGNDLRDARFIKRLNRFSALVEIDGSETTVHVPNSGRMGELFVAGQRIYLTPVVKEHRKTAYDLVLVDLEHSLCSTDSRLPPYLIQEAFIEHKLNQFEEYDTLRREVPLEESRIDLALSGSKGICYVETKSVTLVQEGIALFPDSPTERGCKHIRSLVKALEFGHRAVVIFVVQRPDAHVFSINDVADPQFSQGLRDAMARGLEAYAYKCEVNTQTVALDTQILFKL